MTRFKNVDWMGCISLFRRKSYFFGREILNNHSFNIFSK